MKVSLYICLAYLVFLTQGLAQTASSKVTPQVLPKGQKGSYQITLDGTSSAKEIGGSLPKVSGLQLSGGASTSTQMQFINGRAKHQITYSFPLTGDKLGTFTIPAWNMHFGNRIISVPATTVKIVDSKDVYKGVFELDLTLDKTSYYVGEPIEGELKLWVRNGVEARLGDNLEKLGDAFVQESLEQASWKISPVVRNGLRYEMAQLKLNFTAIKPGLQSLSYKLPILARVPNQQTRFRDPFFDDFFPGRRQFKEVTVESDEKKWEIKPLPTKGKPETFSGAVGKFAAAISYTPKQVSAGEPVTLKFEVSGNGNFERIQAPKLVNTKNHKVYPPKIDFQPSTSNSKVKGTKTFEYIVIPKHEKADVLMDIPFVYFDPEPGIYVDITQTPEEMVVLPSPEGTNPIALPPTSGSQRSGQKMHNLLPIKTKANQWQSPGPAPIWTPAYLGAQLSSLALVFGFAFFRKRQNQLANDSLLRHQNKLSKEVKEWQRQAADALAASDPHLFLEAACKSIQATISKKSTDGSYEAITFEDVRSFMDSRKTGEEVIEHARTIFDAADLLKFAGNSKSAINFDELNQSLEKVLDSLS